MKILHITNWYPNKLNPKEAIWIERHITSIAEYLDAQFILHIEVKPSGKFHFIRNNKQDLIQRILFVPTKKWALIEMLTTLFLCFYLVKLKASKKFDIINFHIAYPLLTYWHLIRRVIKIPIVITEHWSAYHFHFNVREPEKLKRIKRIFQQGIPVITVSEALRGDIQKFAGNSQFFTNIVPNIVSQEFINSSSPQNKAGNNTFFMISGWKWPKRPCIVIDAFAAFLEGTEKDYFLRIGGYGPLLPEMRKQVVELGLTDKVSFLGKLDSANIAEEMKAANAFLHCSEYETFSVVCAESLCSGCPVIASNVGGISEFVNETNGILVDENSRINWEKAFGSFSQIKFNRMDIAMVASGKFSSLEIGERYYKALSEIINGFDR